MSSAQLGIGTKLYYETVPGASPLAFTAVPEAGDIPGLGSDREYVEVTNQDSAGYREYIPGLNDASELQIPMNYLPNNAVSAAIWTMSQAANGGKRKWRIVETTASPNITFQGDAFVAKFDPAMPVADKKVGTLTLRRTGAWTRT